MKRERLNCEMASGCAKPGWICVKVLGFGLNTWLWCWPAFFLPPCLLSEDFCLPCDMETPPSVWSSSVQELGLPSALGFCDQCCCEHVCMEVTVYPCCPFFPGCMCWNPEDGSHVVILFNHVKRSACFRSRGWEPWLLHGFANTWHWPSDWRRAAGAAKEVSLWHFPHARC